MHRYISHYIELLQKENYKSFYLAFLRVALCCWLLKELFINWDSLDLLYGTSAFVEANAISHRNFIYEIFTLAKGHHGWFIFAYTFVIALNLLGVGKHISATVLFLFVCLLQRLNMSIINGGDILARMILFYLIFAGSYHHFVLFKEKEDNTELKKIRNLISNFAALSIMLQLCMAYFSAGIYKLIDPVWFRGEATYYVMSMERYTGTGWNRYIVHQRWFDYIANYATLLFELLFPLLVWKKKFRRPLLAAGLLFHAFIYVFLMIYGFEVVFVLTYGLFLSNRQCHNIFDKLASYFRFRKQPLSAL